MNDTSALGGLDVDEAADASPLRVALGFFILPLLLVIGGVVVFFFFGALAHDEKPPMEYLAEVTGGGINEPWQAAFHLAQRISNDPALHGDPTLARQIAQALENRNARDPEVRKFLVSALGTVGHADSVPVLVGYLDDQAADVRFNAVSSLGKIGAPAATAAAPQVGERLRDDDVGVRTIAAYVLGALDNPDSRRALVVALNDPAFPVRGNAAVSLAQLGDDAGVGELARMIDRDYLESTPEMTAQQRQDAMLAAVHALGLLGAPADTRDALVELSRDDADLRVRDAARQALALAAQRAAANR